MASWSVSGVFVAPRDAFFLFRNHNRHFITIAFQIGRKNAANFSDSSDVVAICLVIQSAVSVSGSSRACYSGSSILYRHPNISYYATSKSVSVVLGVEDNTIQTHRMGS